MKHTGTNGHEAPLPRNWRNVNLSDVCHIEMGTSPPGHTYNRKGTGFPLLNGPTEFGARHPIATQWTTEPVRFAEPGDILFCVRGATTGRKNVADQRYCIGRGLAAIRGRNGVADTDFLWFLLDVVTASLVSRAAGSTFVNLPGAELERFQVPLPPVAEQRRIAGMLQARLAAVERARAAAQAQLQAAKALPAAYLREVFGSSTAKRWPISRFADIVHEMRYGTSNKSGSQGYATLRIPNVVGGRVDLTELTRVPVDEKDFRKLQLLEGDILFVRTNGNPHHIGRSAVFAWEEMTRLGVDASAVIFASYLIRARLNLSLVIPRFVQLYLQSESGRAELLSHCKTSAGQFNISTAGLGALSIPLPPLAAQKEVIAFADGRFDASEYVKTSIHDQLAKINLLPAAILRRAFSGSL